MLFIKKNHAPVWLFFVFLTLHSRSCYDTAFQISSNGIYLNNILTFNYSTNMTILSFLLRGYWKAHLFPCHYFWKQKIPAFGYFILGQEQDEVGRNFSLGESFYGSMSQLNLWNIVLSEVEIAEMSRYRCDQVVGNELAWPDFLEKTVEVSKTTEFCTG